MDRKTARAIYETVTQHLKEKIRIEYGTDNWISKTGTVLILLALFFFLPTLFILLTGRNLPIDASIFYYGFMIPKYVYYFFGGSLILSWLGLKISEVQKWSESNFCYDDKEVEFDWKNDLVKLEKGRILKIIFKNSTLTNKTRVKIKTIGIKSYLLRMDKMDAKCFFEKFDDRIFEATPYGLQKKTLGNNG